MSMKKSQPQAHDSQKNTDLKQTAHDDDNGTKEVIAPADQKAQKLDSALYITLNDELDSQTLKIVRTAKNLKRSVRRIADEKQVQATDVADFDPMPKVDDQFSLNVSMN